MLGKPAVAPYMPVDKNGKKHFKYTGREFNTSLITEVNKLAMQYDLEDVYDSICAMEDKIKDIISRKIFQSEYGRIRYVLAIVENNIAVVKAAKEKKERLEKIREMREKRIQKNNTEAGITLGTKEVNRKVKDISEFLD